MATLTVLAPDGVPEVVPGDDLAALLLDVAEVADGDIVVVTSKVVSKAEGRLRPGDRDAALAGETARVVARRGPTAIVRTHHGLTMAAAGIDASNVAAGHVLLLPEDPDRSARRLRRELHSRTGRTLGVLVSDTAGRAWREGQTDIAIGAAGVVVAEDYAGRHDAHGNPLVVTAPAVADELAGAAELASGKLGGRPFSVIRGRSDLVLPADEDGPGARALVREEGQDLFGYGSREAVLRALLGRDEDRTPFGTATSGPELVAALDLVAPGRVRPVESGPVESGPLESGLVVEVTDADALTRVAAVSFASGWVVTDSGGSSDSPIRVHLRPTTP
ncbi:coenzyme F420-0:L-glutamate ligase [Nocardioides sp.]|uniref:coenzyme F420-0:L-glutamate ligase n=1 Tax=Nocardioides sp. TaxID=35761 RepID=UPI002735D2FD|nr:coenzyme F420-0:L-glutamate ligase [Nocardioides sp.]MDP3894751.1 coenzyme F420-0:L-glutamate ligase [Nocardioides sp.]